MYIGLVPKDYTIEIQVMDQQDWKTYVMIICTLIASLSLTAVCIFQTSHTVIKPLRRLNTRMREILESENLGEVRLREGDKNTCEEITQLYTSFNNLISDYKFIQNDFMKKDKPDIMAAIDLAEACLLFNG